MAGPSSYDSLPNVDIDHPDFSRQHLMWAYRQQSEIRDLIAGTKETLAESWALLAEADRILALR